MGRKTRNSILIAQFLVLGLISFALTACNLLHINQPALSGQPSARSIKPQQNQPVVYTDISVRAQNERIPVIMYHDIIAKRGSKSVWFDCTRAEFATQMKFIQAQNAKPITMDQLYRHLTLGEAVPAGAIVLTFDDNYQGFYTNAYPILKKLGYPSTMFVHTNYVGTGGDHPKMSWDTLRKLDSDGLVTIASHTLSHPDDITKIPADQQEKELVESKQLLEKQLSHPIPYLAYPDGKYDSSVIEIAKRAGYLMSFTVDNGPAEESPNILAVNRYIHTRLEKAWQDSLDAKTNAPAAVVEQTLSDTPVRLEVKEYAGVKLGIVRGGLPTSRRSASRQSVGEFVRDADGVAGMNGTFFSDARILGTDSSLIGPSQTNPDPMFLPDTAQERLPRLVNRPVIVWGKSKIAIFPFQPGQTNSIEAIQTFMPDFTDCFLAGAWIVHNGVARTAKEMAVYSAGDFDDPRRRAFMGITAKGEIVLGGTLTVVKTSKMAEAAAEAGVQEAFLLDSGFSTSVVYDKRIIVTGHTAKDLPSRPVPHAIVILGKLEPPSDKETIAFLDDCDPAVIKGKTAMEVAQTYGPKTKRRKGDKLNPLDGTLPIDPNSPLKPGVNGLDSPPTLGPIDSGNSADSSTSSIDNTPAPRRRSHRRRRTHKVTHAPKKSDSTDTKPPDSSGDTPPVDKPPPDNSKGDN